MDETKPMKVVESSHVSPPPGSVPTTSLPLTFFDLQWFPLPNVQRLFFYEFPYPTLHFMETILPLLKQSLSLTLQQFFPFAANVVCPPSPGKPYIHYEDGGSSVAFSVVESPSDFRCAIADYPRDVKTLHPFAPHLRTALSEAKDGTRVVLLPALAFQVTVFPNAGVCIGSSYCHVIGDGKAFMHFMKSWVDVYAAVGLEKSSLPLLNKDVIKDPNRVESFLLKMYHDWLSSLRENSGLTDVGSEVNMVRATFVFRRADVERLKQLVASQCMNEANSNQFHHVSTFVVTCALTWVSLIKSKVSVVNTLSYVDDADELYYLLFPFDCRNRLEFPVPSAYFGNCIKPGIVEMKKEELTGENGIVLAAKAIGSKVKEMVQSGISGAENWLTSIAERSKTGRLINLAGSPKLRVYDTNFGWGRPRKVELMHVESGQTISMAECRDEEGGIEVGVALNKNQMDEFVATFGQSLKLL
ncbi:hypothetical protein E1A91_A13G050500v1 [Gossypium mustelinum]|uniref:Uncharacterized protein n=1 Tax=Gossypium mustelinum TaxID=34275 RepID=A0A5D2WDQ6_GOSMU|nr:hypothetical protein E1A91_A13G050500v1 [Gossypium mustelinum]